MTETEEQTIRRLVQERRSRAEIADAIGVSTDTVDSRLAALGIELGTTRRTLKQIVAAYRKAGTCGGAARLLRMSRQGVHKRLRAAGEIP